jgi:hypothetical protein
MVLVMKIRSSTLAAVVKSRKESTGVLLSVCSFCDVNVDIIVVARTQVFGSNKPELAVGH